MLWNFPSFSFLEIGNIKLLFETGLSTSEPRFHENSFTTETELKLIGTAKYSFAAVMMIHSMDDDDDRQKMLVQQSLWLPEESVGHPHFAPLSHCEVPDVSILYPRQFFFLLGHNTSLCYIFGDVSLLDLPTNVVELEPETD